MSSAAVHPDPRHNNYCSSCVPCPCPAGAPPRLTNSRNCTIHPQSALDETWHELTEANQANEASKIGAAVHEAADIVVTTGRTRRMPPPTFGLIEDECGLNAAAAWEVSRELALNFSPSPSPMAQTDSWEFATPHTHPAAAVRAPVQVTATETLRAAAAHSALGSFAREPTLETAPAAEQCVRSAPSAPRHRTTPSWSTISPAPLAANSSPVSPSPLP
ncbi:hypothetical protein K438DRAFT_1973960 [Mycena galopus ATCC 62051]|nr:hypothetical protein K438DRAFT_1973960 [Mycena galopus ATCC 62051]